MADLIPFYDNNDANDGDDESANNNAAAYDRQSVESRLWKAVNRDDMERLATLLAEIKSGAVPFDVNLGAPAGRSTILQHCCLEQMARAAELLLDAGCDPNATSLNNPSAPLLLASYKGNVAIVRLLTAQPAIQLNAIDGHQSKQTALHKVAQQLPKDKSRYLQCLNILLGDPDPLPTDYTELLGARPARGHRQVDVNAQDSSGNTALHYAAHSGVEQAVLQLLRHGTHLGVKNIFGETAVRRILPSTLESFLDSCVSLNDEQPSSRNFAITFHYSLLAPPYRLAPGEEAVAFVNNGRGGGGGGSGGSDEVDIEERMQAGDTEDVSPESEALWHMSQSDRHQYLLKHPVVTSFLMLKWQNIQYYYYINVAVYLLSVVVLSSYVLLLNSNYPNGNASVQVEIQTFT